MNLIYILIMGLINLSYYSQDKLFSNTADISFISETPIINIAGQNKKVVTFLKPSTGEIAFAVRMTDFEFELPLAKEHFNENYVESEKFPTSTFKGTLLQNESIDYSKEGSYPVVATGELTIHGITKTITEKAVLNIGPNGEISGFSTFKIRPEDYKIKVPKIVREKVAEEVSVTIQVDYKLYNNGK